MEKNTEKNICSLCGNVSNKSQKFCPECGMPLSLPSSSRHLDSGAAKNDTNQNTVMEKNMFIGLGMTGMGMTGMGENPSRPSMQQEQNKEPVNIYPEDSGLKLIADCCNTTGPLAGGIIRSSEIVLYYDERTDGYQVHVYTSSGYGSKKHEGYYTTKEHADLVMQSIVVDTIQKFQERPPLMGGSKILKFRNDNDEVIRVECSTGELSRIKDLVEQLLYKAVCPESRIVPEQAKNWKNFVVFSTGMSMDSCFNYELERTEDGKTRVRGKCFIHGTAHEQGNWIEISKKEADELEKIPLGLMLSDVVTKPVMSAGDGMVVLDGGSMSVSITYADGKHDTKIPDREMIRILDELMKRVL